MQSRLFLSRKNGKNAGCQLNDCLLVGGLPGMGHGVSQWAFGQGVIGVRSNFRSALHILLFDPRYELFESFELCCIIKTTPFQAAGDLSFLLCDIPFTPESTQSYIFNSRNTSLSLLRSGAQQLRILRERFIWIDFLNNTCGAICAAMCKSLLG